MLSTVVVRARRSVVAGIPLSCTRSYAPSSP